MKKAILVLTIVLGFFLTRSQTLNYYFGNLHSHTAYSDGNKDSTLSGVSKPTGSYTYAKLSQNFDFLGISEHNHYNAAHNPGMKVPLYAQGLAQAAAANTGTFLALYGMEWGTSSTPNGHVVVYGFNQLIGWESNVGGITGPNYNIFNAKGDYDGLFRKVKDNPNAFCYLAHPSSFYDFDSLFYYYSPYNTAYDSAIVGVPLRNGIATDSSAIYTNYSTWNYVKFYNRLLNKGYHVGMTYDHDNHYTNFGRGNAGRLVILAPTLTESNLYYAMKNMHFYGSDDWNAKIDFKIGINIMGDTTSGVADPVINVVHNDMDGELADSIKIWSGVSGSKIDPVIIKTVTGLNTVSYTDTSIIIGQDKYYYAEIIQVGGDRIITSPIWYKQRTFAGIQELKNEISFLMFPNPVNSKLYLSTGLNTNYTVEIMDAAGKNVLKETYSTPDISIAMDKIAKGFYNIKITLGVYSKTKALVIE